MTKRLGLAVLTVLTLALSACGSNDDATASQAISDSIVRTQSSNDAPLLSLKRKDADCIGDGFVERIGTDKLQKYGLLTRDLKSKNSVTTVKMSGGDAKSATDVLFGCADMQGMMQTALSRSGSISPEMRTCIGRALSEPELRRMFTKIFQGQQDQATKELTKPLAKCAAGSNG